MAFEQVTQMRRSCLAIVFLLIYVPAWGATYYVDATGGKDSNSGTATNNAWKTISKVNTSTFSAGDSILFKRGETWREQLTVPSSGVAGNPITFGAYGTGNPPVINGADIIQPGSSWDTPSSNVWRTVLQIEPKIIFFDGIKGNKKASPGALSEVRDWYWGSNILYVYSTDNPYLVYKNPGIETSKRNWAVYIYNKNYVTIYGLDLKYTNSSIVDFRGTMTGVSIKNNTISWGAGSGIIYWLTSGDSNIIDGNTIHDTESDGITGYDKTSALGKETYVKNNIIYNAYKFGIFLRTNYWIIDNNIIHDCGHSTVPGEQYIGIEIVELGSDGRGFNNTVRYNTIYNQKSAGEDGVAIEFDLGANNNIAYYNIAYNNDGPGISIYGSSGNKIYNNVFYGNNRNSSGELTSAAEIRLVGTSSQKINNAVIKNNIAYATGMGVYAITVDGYTVNQTLDISNNIYYSTGTNWFVWNWGGDNNLATWNDKPGVGTDLYLDPKFINPAGGDFNIQSVSPAINSGAVVSLPRDHAGNSVPINNAPDIGAFQYQDKYRIPSSPRGLKVN